jgi:hypothetical protein
MSRKVNKKLLLGIGFVLVCAANFAIPAQAEQLVGCKAACDPAHNISCTDPSCHQCYPNPLGKQCVYDSTI